eukprot:2261390-Amphidinium_carterae.1
MDVKSSGFATERLPASFAHTSGSSGPLSVNELKSCRLGRSFIVRKPKLRSWSGPLLLRGTLLIEKQLGCVVLSVAKVLLTLRADRDGLTFVSFDALPSAVEGDLVACLGTLSPIFWKSPASPRSGRVALGLVSESMVLLILFNCVQCRRPRSGRGALLVAILACC